MKRKTFSAYSRDSKAFALLFDMNRLFESFVASEMKKWHNDEKFRKKNPQYQEFINSIFKKHEVKNISIKTQEKSKFLAENKKTIAIFSN